MMAVCPNHLLHIFHVKRWLSLQTNPFTLGQPASPVVALCVPSLGCLKSMSCLIPPFTPVPTNPSTQSSTRRHQPLFPSPHPSEQAKNVA